MERLARLEDRHPLDTTAAALRDEQVVMDGGFHLVSTTARELLADFRELEESFHLLDRQVRQRIAGGTAAGERYSWTGRHCSHTGPCGPKRRRR